MFPVLTIKKCACFWGRTQLLIVILLTTIQDHSTFTWSMPKNKLPNSLHSSAEDTDSADEVFIFTKKRKVDPCFIDLTEEEGQSQKGQKQIPCNSDKNVNVAGRCDGTLMKQAAGDGEVEVIKFIPPQSLQLQKPEEMATVCIKESTATVISGHDSGTSKVVFTTLHCQGSWGWLL